MNTIGITYRTTIFGTSHGPAVGCVIDGCPPGIRISRDKVQSQLDRRRPGYSDVSSPRKERDRVILLSGLIDSVTTGAPISAFVENKNAESEAYDVFRSIPRPGHADYTAISKYGEHHDHRGGGMFSGRMTIPLVISGSIAMQALESRGIHVAAHSLKIGRISAKSNPPVPNIERIARKNDVGCADPSLAKLMKNEILDAKRDQDSVGGIIECIATGLPVGAGEPFFDSVESLLSQLIFSIPAIKGVEFGAGFQVADMRGSENNDQFKIRNGKIVTETNNSGGILGGITNGMPLILRVAVKPTPSIAKTQKSVNLQKMKETDLQVTGRHDPCIVPRAVPVVESVVSIGILDLMITGGLF
ncbi:MAG: chorismate synthase [Thermoplasmata archaeon]|nr:chorismate synthase [Thermoplasmata archaeon]